MTLMRRPFGVLGGTFDPIHLGHLAIAEQAAETLDLEVVIFVPAGLPPHKRDQTVTSAHHRVAMVELAIAGAPRFRVSRCEVDRPGPSYTVDTVRLLTSGALGEHRPEPVVILSAEAVRGLRTWHEPDRLLDLCRVAVVPRRGYEPPSAARLAELFPGRQDRFVLLDGPDLGHSASDIRSRVGSGRSVRYLVPPAVEGYIRTHHLYRPASTGEALIDGG